MKRYVIGLGAVALLILVGGAAASCHYRDKAQTAEAAANVAQGEVRALSEQAQAKDAKIAAGNQWLEESRAEVARKVAELARIRAVHGSGTPNKPEQGQPVLPGVVDLAPVVAAQDAVIQAQTVHIGNLENQVVDLRISRDLWKASTEASQREAAGLRIALEAQKSLTKSALWKGRLQGVVIGVGAGYVTGRVR